MFLGRVDHFLGGKLLESADDAEAGVARLDDVVDVAVASCIVGVAEQLVVFLFLLPEHFGGVVGSLGLFGIEHLDGTCATHHGNLGGGPSVVHVAAELLARHHDVAAAVALAECDGDLGHGGFAVGIEQLGSVEDHAVVFLACAGEEAGNVDEGHEGGC